MHLRNIGVDPYSGDLFHETPLGLVTFDFIQKNFSFHGLYLFFVIVDLATAFLLGKTASRYVKESVSKFFFLLVKKKT